MPPTVNTPGGIPPTGLLCGRPIGYGFVSPSQCWTHSQMPITGPVGHSEPLLVSPQVDVPRERLESLSEAIF